MGVLNSRDSSNDNDQTQQGATVEEAISALQSDQPI